MKIFKTDSTGKVRFLEMKVVDDNISQSSGILGSENVVTHEKRATPKNVGKANETTAEEQALAEMEATIVKKLKEGYFLTIEEAKSTYVLLPMLAKVYKEEQHKIDWSLAYCQPKFDGMRMLAIVKDGNVTLMSRKGREITTLPHIEKALTGIKDCVLDGEAYNLSLGSFQNQMKAIKKYTKGLSEQVQFNVYDKVGEEVFTKRFNEAARIVFEVADTSIVCCPTYYVANEEELIRFNKLNVEAGYEGTMVRISKGGYEIDKRSSNLLKYKSFLDTSLKIKDIIPSKQRPNWGQPIFELNGETFSAGMKYSHEEREEFLTNKDEYIGKIAELRFFEYSDIGVPRFPIMHGIRPDL